VVSKLEREKTADDDEKTQLKVSPAPFHSYICEAYDSLFIKNELEMVKRAYLQLQSEKTQFEQRSHEQELTLKDVVINQRRELDTLSVRKPDPASLKPCSIAHFWIDFRTQGLLFH
jgi:hypothetical protein